jgi:hypothetical protein
MTMSLNDAAGSVAAELVDCLLERDFAAAQDVIQLLRGYCTPPFAGLLDEAFTGACLDRGICPICGSPMTARREIINYADRPFGHGLVPEYGYRAVCSDGCDGPVLG